MADINLMVASDNGNSEHDMIINGELIRQPNVISKVRHLPNMDEFNVSHIISNINDNVIVTLENPSGIYYSGNYALNSSQTVRSIDVGVDNNKVESDIVFINILSQCAAFATKKYYSENGAFNKTITVDVDMATSLPIQQYNKKNAEEFASKFTENVHRITTHVGSLSARIELTFSFVKVIPEGVTASHALVNDDKYYLNRADIKKSDFKEAKILHIAIGEGTTEYPVTQGIAFNPEFIKGSNNGIGHAIDKGLDEFRDKKALPNLSRQDYSKIIMDKKHKYHADAMEIIEDYIEEQAEAIFHTAKGELQKANNDVDVIAVYGGGSILMRPFLVKKLEKISERAETKLLYIGSDYAVTIEAEGLWAFVNSPIFKALKAKKKQKVVAQ